MRVVSAAILIAGIGATIWVLPPWATAVLAAVVAALAATELARIAAKVGAPVPAAFAGLGAALLSVAFVFYEPRIAGSETDSLGAVILALLVASALVSLALGPPTPTTLSRAGLLVMAPVYVGLPLGAIVWVHWVFGASTTTWLIGTIAASDSAQYYTGRMFGRTKLAPTVSPAKTVEGVVGGLAAAGILGAIVGPWCIPNLSASFSAVIALTIATFGIAGDLFESLLKRSAGVKDSSRLIPGHGGMLDRIDSYLIAAPVFYLFLRYFV